MPPHARVRRSGAVHPLVLASLLLTAAWAGAQAPAGQPAPTEPPATESTGGTAPLVLVAEVDGIIHPVSAEFMIATMERADQEGAALVVFVLRTPGGLVDSTQEIVSRMVRNRTPVAVWVGPGGSRAASAGFVLTIAADIAAMAPGTSIGAAHPVAGGGQQTDETMAKKAASDFAAYTRSIAAKRGRNVPLAEAAVLESRAFTDREALEADPPLIDLIASSVEDLVAQLHERKLQRFDADTVTVLHTEGARTERVEMTWRQRLLSAIAHPQVAYLLFSLGTLGLTIELWNPGAILPGVVGGVCLLLAFFAFQILPVNYAGLALIVFGISLLVLEIKVTSFGLLAVGGVVSLLLGSLMLMDSPLPEMQIGLRLILPIVLAMSGIILFLVRLGVEAQRRRSYTGTSGMIDEPGRALTAFSPGQFGRVATHGEIWQATAEEPIAEGETIQVVAVDGLTLRVRRADRGQGVST
jgi:membrane-bound serine protease (ClpP class)